MSGGGFPGFIADLDMMVEALRRRAAAAGANPQERQRLIQQVRRMIGQIKHWEQQTTDEGDLILLEVAREDCEAVLRSLGIRQEARSPTMRDLLDRIAV